MELKEQSVKSALVVGLWVWPHTAEMLKLLLVCYGNLSAFSLQVGVI